MVDSTLVLMTILMFVGLFVGLFLGHPLAFVLGGLAVIFGLVVDTVTGKADDKITADLKKKVLVPSN